MLALDVTSDASVEAAVSELMRLEGRIDLLVNNAGFGVAPAGAEESSLDQARAIFDTNFFGIVRMTRAVVPHMRRQGSGRIINIGSVLGLVPQPYGALYAATKHAVEGYSESLDHELRTRGIRVSVIEPAYTKTQFDANFLEPDAKLDEYREIRLALGKTLTKVMANCRRTERRGRRGAESRQRGSSKTSIHGGRRRGSCSIAAQICPGRLAGCGHSQGPESRRPCSFDASPRNETFGTRKYMKAFSAVGIVLLPFLLAACNEATPSTDPRTQPPLVRVGTVATSVQAERSFTGIVAARVQSDLGFRVPGKVLERLVDTGQTVKRGQPLMRIDPDGPEARHARARGGRCRR